MRALAHTMDRVEESRANPAWPAAVIALALACLFLGAPCIWSKARVIEAGERVQGLEEQIANLNPRIVGLESQIARLKSPSAIKGRLMENGIDMVIPFPEHEVYLEDSLGLTRAGDSRRRARGNS